MNWIIEDYVAIGLVVLTGVIKLLTNTVMWMTQDLCGKVGVMTTMETDPIGRWILDFFKFEFIISFLIFPALIIGYYFYVRHKYKETDRPMLRLIVSMLFFVLALNFFNDAGAFLGLFLRGG